MDAEGKTYTINYVADENGYRAQGDHLPVAPEAAAVPEVKVPVAIVAQVKTVLPASTYNLPLVRSALPLAAPPAFGYGYNFAYPYNYGYAHTFNGFPFVY